VAVLLEQAGARVVRYATAEDALAALRSGAADPQIVLSDIQLAGTLTGVDLAHALAREDRGLPIVLMTGYTDRLQEAVAQGYRVLPKPTPPDRLLQALAEALAGTQPQAA
jgi:DNA-binding NtrC family response regulator